MNKDLHDKIIIAELKAIKKLLTQSKMIFTADEAANYIGVSLSYLYKLTSSGILPFSKPNGKLIYFSKAGLDEWVMSNQSKSAIQKDIDASTHISKSR